MNKQVIKWSGIAFLLALCIFCAYSYNALFVNVEEQTPDDTPVVAPPAEEDEEELPVYTVFPKPPMLSPYSHTGYMQNVGGSRDDTLCSLFSLGTLTYVVGHTFSNDYDFSATDPGVFVATVSQNGMLTKTQYLSQNSLYLASTLFSSGIVVSTTSQSGLVTHFLDGNLNVQNVVRHDVLVSSGRHILSGTDVFGAFLAKNTLFLTKTDSSLTTSLSKKIPCDNLSEIVDFSVLGDKIFILANTKTDFYFIILDENLNEKSRAKITATGTLVAHSAIPSVYRGEGSYVLTARHGDTLSLMCVNQDGLTEWSKSLMKGTKSKVIRTANANLLVFCATEKNSYASIYCSHGDLLEQNVLSFSGYFPVDFTYSDALLLLLSPIDKKTGGAIASLSNDNLSTVILTLPEFVPVTLTVSPDELLLGVNADNSTSGFYAYGGKDCFVITL